MNVPKFIIYFSSQTFGAIGLLAVNFPFPYSLYASHFNLGGGIAVVVTLVLLLILICKANLRQSSLLRKIEIYIYITLITLYAVGSYEMFWGWYWSYDEFLSRHSSSPDMAQYSYRQLRTLFGSVLALVC